MPWACLEQLHEALDHGSPLAVFLLVAVFLYKGLFLKPDELPSAMIGKPFPAFSWPRPRATVP